MMRKEVLALLAAVLVATGSEAAKNLSLTTR